MKECPTCADVLEDAAERCPRDDSALDLVFEGSFVLDGKYRLECRIGKGGMGAVYRGVHVALGRSFAIKLIKLDVEGSFEDRAVERFRIEAEALGRLKHPNIVGVTDFGVDPRQGGLPYLVMEQLEGESLRDFCRKSPCVAADEGLPFLEGIAAGLDAAHARGVLHRDLKPANVLMAMEPDGRLVPKILDFGLARFLQSDEMEPRSNGVRAPALRLEQVNAADAQTMEMKIGEATRPLTEALPSGAFEALAVTTESSGRREDSSRRLTVAGTILGTLSYMAPEMLRGEETTASSDIYSFGILAYEMLTGSLPFRGESIAIARGHLWGEPVAPSKVRNDIPAELDTPLLALLRKDPTARPATARRAVAALRAALVRAEVRKWRERERPRRKVLAAAMALGAAALVPLLSSLALVERLELPLVDWRFAVAPRHSPDPAIVLVVLDEPSLDSDPTPLTQRAAEVGGLIDTLFAAGADSVAIDFLFPRQWNLSERFNDAVLRHAHRLTLAALSNPQGHVVGPESLSPLVAGLLGPEPSDRLFAWINVQPDRDGMVRRGRFAYRDRERGERETFAARAAGLFRAIPRPPHRAYWIDFTCDWEQIARISWKDLAERLQREPSLVRGRFVLVGGDFEGSGDVHAIAQGPKEIAGVLLQAMMIDSLLGSLPVREAPRMVEVIVTGVLAAALAVTILLGRRRRVAVIAVILFAMMYGYVAFALFAWMRLLIGIVAPCMAIALACVAASVTRLALPRFPEPGGTKEEDQ